VRCASAWWVSGPDLVQLGKKDLVLSRSQRTMMGASTLTRKKNGRFK
jgi:hypothetical protein